MSDMIINNMSSSVMATSELSLMQQELIKASVEYEKQYGIIMQLIRKLQAKKLKAVNDKYKETTVFHNKYGECRYSFDANAQENGITLTLSYWVKNIPLGGLSENDKKIAKKYNAYTYCYEQAEDTAREFKSFKDKYDLYGEVHWMFSMDDICDSKFIERGLAIGDDEHGSFTIRLE